MEVIGPQCIRADCLRPLPMAWTPNSKAVLFTSDRTGVFQVYRQDIDKENAEAFTCGRETGEEVRLSPDGKWLLYTISEANSTKARVMRIPVAGGEPEQVLVDDGFLDVQCSRVSGDPCDIVEATGRTLTVSVFDPMRGRGPRILETDRRAGGPGISPDGKHVAFLLFENPLKRIRIVDLLGVTEAEITVPAVDNLAFMDWTSDGSGFFAAEQRGTTETRLLHVDRSGAAQVLWSEPGIQDLWGIPSPDGRYLATFRTTVSANVWMIKNPQ